MLKVGKIVEDRSGQEPRKDRSPRDTEVWCRGNGMNLAEELVPREAF